MELVYLCSNDPQVFDYVSFEGQGHHSNKVDAVEHFTLSIAKDEPYALDGDLLIIAGLQM